MAEDARNDRLIVEGLAIVSADGMIADRWGVQPDALKLEADQRFFHGHLRSADVLVHGRNSGEGNSRRRRRIVLTRRIAALARDPANPNAVLWNPAGASWEAAWAQAKAFLQPPGQRIAVIGGTDVFGLFLTVGYDVFHLSRAEKALLPGGRPLFPGVPDRSPEELLADHGLKPGETRVLDAATALTVTAWHRL